MSQNVKLPLELLTGVVRLMLRIDTSYYDENFRLEYDSVLEGLHNKLSAMALRDAYSKIIFAKDDVSRSAARTQYLQQKRSSQEDC